MISSSAEIKRRIFIGLFGCLTSGFWSNRSAVRSFFWIFSSRFWFYIMMFWFLLPGDRTSFLHNLACVDVCFLCRRSPPTHRGSCFTFPDASLNPEIWEEVSSECCCCSKEHPSAALPGKISLFSYANELLFRVGAVEGGAAPKMWAGIRVGLFRNGSRLEGSLFWPNESGFF